MKNMRQGQSAIKPLFFLFGLMGFLSCSTNIEQDTIKIIEGEVITIDFETTTPYEEGHYIKVDSYRIPHIAIENDRRELPYSMPTTDYAIEARFGEETSNNDDRVRSYKMKTDNIGIAMSFLNALSVATRNDSTKYQILSHAEASLLAKVRLIRTDSSKITIEIPANYPANINEKPFFEN